MKRLLISIIAIISLSAGIAYAAPVSNIFNNILPAANDTYDLGSTTPAAEWNKLFVKTICLSTDCKSAWPSGGAGTFSFTPQSYGNSTSTTLGFLNGLLSVGSTTISTLGSGLVGANNGLLYGISGTSSLNASITGSAGSVANAVTFNNGGSGAASGQTYNGSSAQTISYNTLGAVPTTRNVNTTYPFQGGGALSGDLILTTAFGTTTTNIFSQQNTFNAQTNMLGPLVIGTSTASTTIWGNTATSTFASGINLTNGGCLAYNGVCLTAGILAGGSSQAVNWATTAALPSNNYVNGVSGVGATIAEISNGALSVDGNSPAVGDRVLVKNEGTQTHNGIYVVSLTGSAIATFLLTRALDYDQAIDVTPGITTYVLTGTANGDTTWALTSAAPITVGSTNLTYAVTSNGNITIPVTVAQGGTGQQTFTSSQLLYGNGTNALTSVATTTLTFSSFPANLSAVMGALVGGNNATWTWWGLATTSALTQGQLLYNTTGGNGVASVATTSGTCGSGITCTAVPYIGSVNPSFALSTIAANNFLANNTANTAIPIAVSTTTIFGALGAPGTVPMSSGGAIIWAATSSVAGTGAAFAWTPTQNFGVNTNATSTTLSLFKGFNASTTVTFGSTGTTTLTWNSNLGALGVGTSSPYAMLSIFAASTTGSLIEPQYLFAIASSTVLGATTTLFAVDNTGSITTRLGNALILSGGAGNALSAYGGASSCSNQAMTGFSATGASTCTSINNAWWSGTQLSVANGGTGQQTFTSSQLLYGNGTNALSSVATSSLSASSPLTGSFTVINANGSAGSIGCQTASASQGGCISQTDYNTFNGKDSFAWPFTPTNNFGINTNATSTRMSFFGGIYASSTQSTPNVLDILAVGTSTMQYNSPFEVATTSTSTLQSVFRNNFSGATSSVDIILENATSTNSTYFGDLGMNSPINADYLFTGFAPHDTYLFSSDANLDFATASSTVGSLQFFTGGALLANKRMSIDKNGNVTIGTLNGLISGNSGLLYAAATSSPTFNGGLTTTGTAGAWVGGSSYAVTLANINANSVLGNSSSASAQPTSLATSSLFTFSPAFNASGTLQNVVEKSFTVASSTWGVATSTYALEQSILAKTYNGVRCKVYPSGATLDVQLGKWTASTTMLVASSTNNFNAFSSNNTVAAADSWYVAVGTAASSPTMINCTYQQTI